MPPGLTSPLPARTVTPPWVSRDPHPGTTMVKAGTTDRRDLGISLHQTLYQGGRVSAGVGAAESAFAADAAAMDAARSDLILAVRQAWYQAAQAHRLVISSEQGLERSRLNLEFAEAQLLAGLGTRPDVLRARVDVSAAELELTTVRQRGGGGPGHL